MQHIRNVCFAKLFTHTIILSRVDIFQGKVHFFLSVCSTSKSTNLFLCAANDVTEIVDEGEGRKPQRAHSRTATLKKTRRKTLKRSSKRKSKKAEGEEKGRKEMEGE